MKAVFIGNVELDFAFCKDQFESITCITNASELDRLACEGYVLVIANDSINALVGNLDIFDCFPDDRVYAFVWGSLFKLSDEVDILEKLKQSRQTKDLLKIKIINQALMVFDFIKRRTKLNSLPNYIQFESTSYCNAKCIMCSHSYMGNLEAAHMESNLIKNLTNELDSCVAVALHGIGEPFIHPQIEAIIKMYASHGVFLSTSTNLSVLTSSLIELIKKHFVCLDISCDGATKETFESIRRNLSFETFKKNLTLLKNNCPNLEKKFNMVIMRQNIHEMCDLLTMAAEYGISFVSFSNLKPNIAIGDYDEAMINYPAVLNYYCQQAYALARKLSIKISCPIPETQPFEKNDAVILEETKMYKGLGTRTYRSVDQMIELSKVAQKEMAIPKIEASDIDCCGICEWIMDRTYIDLYGNTCLCCCRPVFKSGKINDFVSLEDVWNNEWYQKMREIFYSGKLPNCCVDCGFLETHRIQLVKIPDNEKLKKEAMLQRKATRKVSEDMINTN